MGIIVLAGSCPAAPRRRRRSPTIRLYTPALLLLLAACGREEAAGNGGKAEGGNNMTRAEVAAELADLQIEPGQWETSLQLLSVEAPDMPREIEQAMRQRGTRSIQTCITPEQARPEAFNRQIAQAGDTCQMRDFSMTGGRMTGRMVCRQDGAGETVSDMSGTYTARSFDYRFTTRTDAPAMGGAVNADLRVTGRRLGPCRAAEGEGGGEGE